MSETDHVMLFDDPDQRVRTHLLRWKASWPPPEELLLVTGRSTSVQALVIPQGLPELKALAARDGVDVNTLYKIERYTRQSYSELPESAVGPDSHVARGAAYIKEQK